MQSLIFMRRINAPGIYLTPLIFLHIGREIVSLLSNMWRLSLEDRIDPNSGRTIVDEVCLDFYTLFWPISYHASVDVTIDNRRKGVHRVYQELKVLLRISSSVRCSISLSSSWDTSRHLDSGIPESTVSRTFSSSTSLWIFRIVSSWSAVLNSYFHLVHMTFCVSLNHLFSRITGRSHWALPS